ncbi:MAG: hypothetical protein ACYCOU_20985 [Sulfobacillus sp.]
MKLEGRYADLARMMRANRMIYDACGPGLADLSNAMVFLRQRFCGQPDYSYRNNQWPYVAVYRAISSESFLVRAATSLAEVMMNKFEYNVDMIPQMTEIALRGLLLHDLCYLAPDSVICKEIVRHEESYLTNQEQKPSAQSGHPLYNPKIVQLLRAHRLMRARLRLPDEEAATLSQEYENRILPALPRLVSMGLERAVADMREKLPPMVSEAVAEGLVPSLVSFRPVGGLPARDERFQERVAARAAEATARAIDENGIQLRSFFASLDGMVSEAVKTEIAQAGGNVDELMLNDELRKAIDQAMLWYWTQRGGQHVVRGTYERAARLSPRELIPWLTEMLCSTKTYRAERQTISYLYRLMTDGSQKLAEMASSMAEQVDFSQHEIDWIVTKINSLLPTEVSQRIADLKAIVPETVDAIMARGRRQRQSRQEGGYARRILRRGRP